MQNQLHFNNNLWAVQGNWQNRNPWFGGAPVLPLGSPLNGLNPALIA